MPLLTINLVLEVFPAKIDGSQNFQTFSTRHHFMAIDEAS